MFAIGAMSQFETDATLGRRNRAMVRPAPTLIVHPPSRSTVAKPCSSVRVVAHEHGQASGERRLRHEVVDGGALVASFGQHFDQHLSFLHRVACRVDDLATHRFMHVRGEVRRGAVVQRDGRALVLDQELGMPLGERAEELAELRVRFLARRVQVNRAVGVAALAAVLPARSGA
jgi:hypothetical protein